MKTLILLILGGGLAIFAAERPAATPALSSVQKVYLLPMAGGLDQYLADWLTRERVFTVVADPKQADAVWSDRVDSGFGNAMDELYPPAKPAKPKEGTEAEQKEQKPRRAFPRGRGNIFLIGVASRHVIWSTYDKMVDTSPRGLHRIARDIVTKLKKDLGRT